MEVVGNSAEKYMTIRIGDIRFLDSLHFMNGSLRDLTDNLKNSDPKLESFRHTLPGSGLEPEDMTPPDKDTQMSE